MRDPLEGLASDGTIRTGAARQRIAAHLLPAVQTSVARISAGAPEVSVYVYGSVATGVADPPLSDLDLLTIGLGPEAAATISEALSGEFADTCRGVEIAAAMPSDFEGDGDEAFGGRVFLHHYCVHLSGPDRDRATTAFQGDRRAARGFNGDIARHARDWSLLQNEIDPATLGRRIGRKVLLAVGGLVSVHDSTWTTDREHAAHRWAEVHPELAPGLNELLEWSAGRSEADATTLAERLDPVVTSIVRQFAEDIGLWPETG